MRIRSSHIVFLLLFLIAGFVVFSVQLLPEEGAVATGSLPPVADPDAVPVIEIETDDKHLGTVANDRITRAPLTVYNRGKAPLELRSVKTTCACTQGEIAPDGKIIPPGGAGEVIIVFDPRRVPGFTSTKQLTIWSNDLKTPQASVNVTADVKPEFTMSSRDVKFGEVSKRDLPKQTLVLRQAQEEPFVIRDVSPRNVAAIPGANDLVLSLKERPEDTWEQPGMREYEITVALPADTPPGALQRLFDIRTDIPRLPVLPVRVTATVTAPYTIEPAFPQPVALRPGTTANITIAAAQPVSVESVEANPAFLEVTTQAAGEGTRVQLIVQPAAQAPSGVFTETVRFTVRSGDEAFPEKAVVRGMVGPAVASR